MELLYGLNSSNFFRHHWSLIQNFIAISLTLFITVINKYDHVCLHITAIYDCKIQSNIVRFIVVGLCELQYVTATNYCLFRYHRFLRFITTTSCRSNNILIFSRHFSVNQELNFCLIV